MEKKIFANMVWEDMVGKWEIVDEKEAEYLLVPISPNPSAIRVNVNWKGDIIAEKYPGRPYCEPYWIGDETESNGYKICHIAKIDGKIFAAMEIKQITP